MKTKFLAALLAANLGLGASAFADTHLFECKIKEDGQTVTVRFGVRNLSDAKKAELVEVKGSSEENGPIVVEPLKVKGYYSAMTTLNGQGGDLRVGKDRLTLFGDDDGIQYAWLVLYKNGDYTRGWVRVQGPGGKEDDWYQKIRCTHQVD